ncbi:hypothetical protein JHK82_021096 [Glycine max]|nr:hypothetical protein JHK86_021106 [Glycine max]KAG5136365.1 hypothetical protein JHK82_021096 [Glycine max]
MAQVQSGQASEGIIKLFGTTIRLYGRERKEDKNHREDGTDEDIKRADKIIPCPRCKSMETKFCYFNNYNEPDGERPNRRAMTLDESHVATAAHADFRQLFPSQIETKEA